MLEGELLRVSDRRAECREDESAGVAGAAFLDEVTEEVDNRMGRAEKLGCTGVLSSGSISTGPMGRKGRGKGRPFFDFDDDGVEGNISSSSSSISSPSSSSSNIPKSRAPLAPAAVTGPSTPQLFRFGFDDNPNPTPGDAKGDIGRGRGRVDDDGVSPGDRERVRRWSSSRLPKLIISLGAANRPSSASRAD